MNKESFTDHRGQLQLQLHCHAGSAKRDRCRWSASFLLKINHFLMKEPLKKRMDNGIGSSMCPPARNVALIFTPTHKKVDSEPGESSGQPSGQGLHWPAMAISGAKRAPSEISRINYTFYSVASSPWVVRSLGLCAMFGR